MHPTVSYELAQTRITDLRHQAQRDKLARAAAYVPPARNRFLDSLRGWLGRGLTREVHHVARAL